jgi:hypothetical protein
MKARIFVSLVGLAFWLGFATQPALAQEREWSFDTSEEDAYLIFGVPETDDVGVSFWCTIGRGEIRLFVPQASDGLARGQSVKITVDVSGKEFGFNGETAPNEAAGTVSAEVHIETTDPVFAALLAADRFSIRIGKEVGVFPLEGADFESLLRVCERQ